LQTILHDLYDRAGFALVIDYTHNPALPFAEPDQAWLEQHLQAQGLRSGQP
jgi:hypothetical protein